LETKEVMKGTVFWDVTPFNLVEASGFGIEGEQQCCLLACFIVSLFVRAVYPSVMKMEVVLSSETSVNFYRNIGHSRKQCLW
jgi:hypothetical protein